VECRSSAEGIFQNELRRSHDHLMTSQPPTSAFINENIALPAGPLVRIRAPRPADHAAVEHLLASPEARRIGATTGDDAAEHGTLVADSPWGGRIIGHAAWERLSGPRAAVTITVASGFGRWPIAAHLLIRLAKVADAALIPTLVLAGGDELEHLLIRGFGAERLRDGTFEIATQEWAAALATLEHHAAAFPEHGATSRTSADPTPARRPRRSPVVIAGGGVAALECLMALRDLADPGLRIQLVAPDDAFVYRPLQVAEPFSLGAARRYPLARVAADFGAELVADAVVEVRAGDRTAVCASGVTLDYDALVLAPGARPVAAFEHATTFGLDPTHAALHGVLIDLEQELVKDVAYIVPPKTSWSLPLYELALMTAREVWAQGIDDVRLSFVTPEQRPLAIFGPQVSAAVGGLLNAAHVEFFGDAYATVRKGAIELEPGTRTIEVDRVIALPALRGPGIVGVPSDDEGFIRTDAYGAVPGLEGVFAAGDATTFPVKQGGLAAQQADSAAQAAAAWLGAPLTPRPFRPVLRGLLFTGDEDRFLRAAIGGGEGDGTTTVKALWWPPTKIAGLYLAPYLHERTGWAERKPCAGFSEVAVGLEDVRSQG
jgi:sulfide:quinone oxidoreductase